MVLIFSLGGVLCRVVVTLYSSCFFSFFFLPLWFCDLGLWELASGHCINGRRMSKEEEDGEMDVGRGISPRIF